jgi:hypothetical protein
MVGSPPPADYVAPPEQDPEVEARQTTSYTNLVPASEGRMPASSLSRAAARPELNPAPQAKPRRRRRKPFPWTLVAITFVLWGLVVALVVKILA